ncbi:MAG: flavodoxin family protein [Clostridia bacterium]|nr:flavodoxin family protein [Clostridia bacterium]
MNVAIRYFTRSKKGNTKKLADAVSAAIGVDAIDVSVDLNEKVDRLFLINAMYAANIDKEVKEFLERNKDKIGEVVNMNTAASGASTWKAVKKETDRLGVRLSEKEFHCAASWIFINKGLPSDEDFARAKEFAGSMI